MSFALFWWALSTHLAVTQPIDGFLEVLYHAPVTIGLSGAACLLVELLNRLYRTHCYLWTCHLPN